MAILAHATSPAKCYTIPTTPIHFNALLLCVILRSLPWTHFYAIAALVLPLMRPQDNDTVHPLLIVDTISISGDDLAQLLARTSCPSPHVYTKTVPFPSTSTSWPQEGCSTLDGHASPHYPRRPVRVLTARCGASPAHNICSH